MAITAAPATADARADLMRLLAAKWVPPVIGVLADLGVRDGWRSGHHHSSSKSGYLTIRVR